MRYLYDKKNKVANIYSYLKFHHAYNNMVTINSVLFRILIIFLHFIVLINYISYLITISRNDISREISDWIMQRKFFWLPNILGAIGPIAIPVGHIIIFSIVWHGYTLKVDQNFCTCSCWDTVFKGNRHSIYFWKNLKKKKYFVQVLMKLVFPTISICISMQPKIRLKFGCWLWLLWLHFMKVWNI